MFILLQRKLYKTQTAIMTGDARSFTRNNHTKSCRFPVPHIHKIGWQETYTSQKKLLKHSAAPFIIIGDSIATGLRKYQHNWRSYFKNSLNLGISGDPVDVLWREQDISLPHTTLLVIIHCSINNVDQKILLLESWKLLKHLWRIIQK